MLLQNISFHCNSDNVLLFIGNSQRTSLEFLVSSTCDIVFADVSTLDTSIAGNLSNI